MDYQFKNGKLVEYVGINKCGNEEEYDDYLKRLGYHPQCTEYDVRTGYSIFEVCVHPHKSDGSRAAYIIAGDTYYLVYLESFIDFMEFLRYVSPMVNNSVLNDLMATVDELIKRLEKHKIIPEW